MPWQNRIIDSPRLCSVQEGRQRVIQQQLDRTEAAKLKSTLTVFHAILEALTAKTETLLSLNQKILEETVVTSIEEEIIQDELYSLNL